MSIIRESLKQEIKQLPFTLGKLLGAMMAVIGIPAVIWITTRHPSSSWQEVVPYALQGISGILIFHVSSILARHRLKIHVSSGQTQAEKNSVAAVVWTIFAGLVVMAFLLIYLFWYLG